jgi:FtsZ-interacting cell division protein ZipA
LFDREKRRIIVDSGQLVGIIVGIVVVLAIVAVAIFLSRKRRVAAKRDKAAEIREKAKADEFTAREREAKAARAEADAKQAEVDAERLRKEALGRQQEAESARAGSQEQLRKADELDPDVVTAERGDARPGEGGNRAGETRNDAAGEHMRRDRSTRENGAGDGAAHKDGTTHKDGDDQNRGDRPRNL